MTSEMLSGSLKYLRRPLEANVTQGQRVLIVTDFSQDARVWQAAMLILNDIGADAAVALFDARPADYYDPPLTICRAMLQADINVLLTSTGMLHSGAAMAAMAAGIPTVCMDGGMTWEMFQGGAVEADYHEILKLKHYVGERVFGREADEVRVTTQYGTNVTYSVKGRIFIPALPHPDLDPFVAYRRSDEGRTGSVLYTALFPSGEFNVPPIEGSANGVVVIDLTMHHVGRVRQPIVLKVDGGRITAISGGPEARELEAYLAKYGDDNAYMFPTEASVGINRAARVTGIQREDKNIFGSMHFGLGTNIDVGGTVKSCVHMDGVVFAPTVMVDGIERIRDGQFLVPLD